MKRLLCGFFLLVLAACAASVEDAPQPAVGSTQLLPDLGLAPELANDTWLNVEAPLRLADLRGQVVLIDMWTFG